MNPKFPAQLAAKLAANPALFDEMEASLLGDLVFDYYQGALDEEAAAEVAAMIQANPTVQAAYQRVIDAGKYASSEHGKAWLDGMFDRALAASSSSAHLRPAESLFVGLARAITDLFAFRATLARASGEEGLKRKLADGQTQIAVHSDSAGRLWLRVTSTAQELRQGSFKLDIEPAPSVLTFSEVEPGIFSARVCVDEEAAAKLAGGAVPKLTPIPPTQS